MVTTNHIIFSNTATGKHYNDVIMSAMAQIASLTIVYSTVYSGVDQRKHQTSASLAFVREIPRWPGNSPHKGPVTRKMLPFDDVIMRTLFSLIVSVSIWSVIVMMPHFLLYQALAWCLGRPRPIMGENDVLGVAEWLHWWGWSGYHLQPAVMVPFSEEMGATWLDWEQ